LLHIVIEIRFHDPMQGYWLLLNIKFRYSKLTLLHRNGVYMRSVHCAMIQNVLLQLCIFCSEGIGSSLINCFCCNRLVDKSSWMFGFLDNSLLRGSLANQRFTDLNSNYVTGSLIGQSRLPWTVSNEINNLHSSSAFVYKSIVHLLFGRYWSFK